MVRVNVGGNIATVLRQKKEELGWTVTYQTDGPEKFGPQEIRIEPGVGPDGQCFGTLYSGCEFDPGPSLTKAGVSTTAACKVSVGGDLVRAFFVLAPGRRPLTLVWSTSGGSGGSSSDITLHLEEGYTPEMACEKARQNLDLPGDDGGGAASAPST